MSSPHIQIVYKQKLQNFQEESEYITDSFHIGFASSSKEYTKLPFKNSML